MTHEMYVQYIYIHKVFLIDCYSCAEVQLESILLFKHKHFYIFSIFLLHNSCQTTNINSK